MTDDDETREPQQAVPEGGVDLEEPDDTDGFLEVEDRQSAEIREIFGTAFPQYLQPVEEMVEQILSGKGDRESVEALGGMLDSLESASKRMGFDDVHNLLMQLHGRVSRLNPAMNRPAPAEVREGILGDVLELRDLADRMGGGAAEAAVRQQTIFSALKGREDVGELVLRRLSAAGLITVDQLLSSRPDEICAVTGLGPEIVEKVLSLLSSGSAGTPVGVESLHEQVLQKLRAEVEAEASNEDLRSEIERLRAHILEQRAKIDSLDRSLGKTQKEFRRLSGKLDVQTAHLEKLRSKREALLKECASAEETLRNQKGRMEALSNQRRILREQTLALDRSLGGLLGSIGKMRRLAAKGRLRDTE